MYIKKITLAVRREPKQRVQKALWISVNALRCKGTDFASLDWTQAELQKTLKPTL